MKRKFLAVLGLGLTAALVVPAVAPASAATRPTLAQILLSDSKKDAKNGFDSNPNDFDIVTQALLLFPDLTAAASDPKANLTVFLPTDFAFRQLVRDLTGKTVYKESEIFKAVAGLGVDTVKAVLTYHIIGGARIDYATALKADGASLTTLGGGTITVDVQGRFFKRVVLVDKDPDLRDPKVIIANIRASNGIAHVIDRVLLPINA
jgi:uncharacterized surface protein with fasciclin (FAS1) repeats